MMKVTRDTKTAHRHYVNVSDGYQVETSTGSLWVTLAVGAAVLTLGAAVLLVSWLRENDPCPEHLKKMNACHLIDR